MFYFISEFVLIGNKEYLRGGQNQLGDLTSFDGNCLDFLRLLCFILTLMKSPRTNNET